MVFFGGSIKKRKQIIFRFYDVVLDARLIARFFRLIRRQTNYLNKYRIYAKNAGELDRDQARLRDDSLRYWKLPDITRKRPHDLYEPVNRAVTRLMKQASWFPLFSHAQKVF